MSSRCGWAASSGLRAQRTNGGGRRTLPLFPASLSELGHLVSSSPARRRIHTPGSWFWASRLGLGHSTNDFPVWAACRQRTVGILSLFLIINKFPCVCVCVCPVASASLENPDQYSKSGRLTFARQVTRFRRAVCQTQLGPALPILGHLILAMTLRSRCSHPHPTDEETKAQGDEETKVK